jgi:hypothetical protein
MKESEQLVRLLEITSDISTHLDQLQKIQAIHLECMSVLSARLDRLQAQLNDHEKRFNSFN